jgi:putative hydrolase of the HAD superfamily
MRTVIFDLDQTLYPEAEYVKSGFRAVALFVARRLGGDPAPLEREMLGMLQRDGRGRVFNSLLSAHGARGRLSAETLVHVYRTHVPELRLHADAAALLGRLAGPWGLVTDGHPTAQARKIAALNLAERCRAIVCTADLGPEAAKPAAAGFRVCLERLGVDARAAAYVGDDLGKDFAAPRALGVRTVRGVRAIEPGFGWTTVGRDVEAEVVVQDLREAEEYLTR